MLRCSECGKVFDNVFELWVHWKVKHYYEYLRKYFNATPTYVFLEDFTATPSETIWVGDC